MKFKLDENLPIELAEFLIGSGHDATTVVAQGLGGSTDQVIIDHCKEEDRSLVTFDADFGDIRSYPPKEYPGLIVLRLKRQDKNYVLDLFKKIPVLLATEELRGRLWLIEEDRIRVRE